MAQRKQRRRSSSKRGRNVIGQTLSKSVSLVKNTSKKYAPKVKAELEGVGSQVTSGVKKSVPVLQQATRKFLSFFGIKGKTKSKSRRQRKH
jgi:hypothetical protein